METDYLTSGEAAKLLGVNIKTVVRWCREHKLAHIRTLGGHIRILKSEVERLRGNA